MNYKKIYNQLIEKRKINKLYKKNQYCETHHIIPKSIGGSNSKGNLINLTSREHFIAHLLLAKIYGNKMVQALWYMSNNGKYKINSHTYELNKKYYLDICKKITFSKETRKKLSIASTGENNPYFGIKHSDEIRAKMSKNNWLKNGKCTDEYRTKMSESIVLRNSKLNDIEKEFFSKTGKENPAYKKNYLQNKTKEEKESIMIKKKATHKINKDKHLHKGGAGNIFWYGNIYKSINKASMELGYSFKYIKRRVMSKDYKECYFA